MRQSLERNNRGTFHNALIRKDIGKLYNDTFLRQHNGVKLFCHFSGLAGQPFSRTIGSGNVERSKTKKTATSMTREAREDFLLIHYTTQEIYSQSMSCTSQSPDADPSPESWSSSFKVFAVREHNTTQNFCVTRR